MGIETLTPEQAALAGGIVSGIIVSTTIFVLVWYVLLVIAGWKMLEKAGEKGWKSLIPIYNVYMLYKIVDMAGWFWAMIGLGVLMSIISTATGYGPNVSLDQILAYYSNPLLFILSIAVCIFAIVVEIKYAYRTAKVFGHGIGYTIGIILVPNIFWLILGFGKSKYNKKHLK